ncbi:acyl-CoA desaturase [Putridiphycobacter roseus]|uniref:Acyl-CoA desaturase n=1 Tax=Putridiphycobacter roseus TaxID=2219161 RepID=A0A2W1MZ03_9FLAO|nr:acyl-CoA desaturase [Putridiphycobacter roseus]PZE17439.1 acyl-CoA desaturase [Putridiphycobacter roseus]
MTSNTKALKPVKFSPKIGRDFSATLNKRVRMYFKENNISRYANANMVIKTIVMVAMYFVPLGFVLFGGLTNIWLIALMYVIMGFGMAGIGMSVMHDANHGAYSKNEHVNKWVGKIVNLIGGYAVTWKVQHNVLHHSYTNIHGYDEDISPPPFLRFSPNAELKPIHKYQHFYVWFFYSLMTVSWVTTKDFQQLFRYRKMDLTKTENPNFGALLTELIFSKVFYYTTMLVIPIIILPIAWYWIPLFIVLKNLIAGFLLAIVFQPAHVVPETEFVVADIDNNVANNFAIHQMETTANFAPRSKILNWFVGGLNYQVEHHLFPHICHVHYKKISEIVKKTAEEYNVPYNSHRTFAKALVYHTKMIKSLGRK